MTTDAERQRLAGLLSDAVLQDAIAVKELDAIREALVSALLAAPQEPNLVPIRQAVNPDLQARLKAWIRAKGAGGCRMLSEGNACTCPLCDVDDLCAELVRLATENYSLRLAAPPLQSSDHRPRAEPIAARPFDGVNPAGDSRDVGPSGDEPGRTPGAAETPRECVWSQDDGDSMWETTCKHAFEFNDGGPHDNGFTFCGYCGGRLIEMIAGVEIEVEE